MISNTLPYFSLGLFVSFSLNYVDDSVDFLIPNSSFCLFALLFIMKKIAAIKMVTVPMYKTNKEIQLLPPKQ